MEKRTLTHEEAATAAKILVNAVKYIIDNEPDIDTKMASILIILRLMYCIAAEAKLDAEAVAAMRVIGNLTSALSSNLADKLSTNEYVEDRG